MSERCESERQTTAIETLPAGTRNTTASRCRAVRRFGRSSRSEHLQISASVAAASAAACTVVLPAKNNKYHIKREQDLWYIKKQKLRRFELNSANEDKPHRQHGVKLFERDRNADRRWRSGNGADFRGSIRKRE